MADISTLDNHSAENHAYYEAFRGRFSGILKWSQLDQLWQAALAHEADRWFIYAVGDTPPTETASVEKLKLFISEVDKLLRNDHGESYCGIVYADDQKNPSFIKIFDPNNLGAVCGSSGNPPLPAWILSRMPPIDLPAAMPQPRNRQRWWQKIFA